MTQADMAKQLAFLSSATGKRFEQGDVVLWCDMLKDLPDAAVKAAVARYVRERKDFPTVSDIRQMAAEAQAGELDEAAAAFDRITKAVRRYGSYDRDGAKASVDPLTWAAMEAAGGWGWVCDLTADNRQTYAAQFRMAYQALAGREERHRRLPAALRPGITNETPMVSLPRPQAKPEGRPKALPAPPQPTDEQLAKALRLRVFRDPAEAREQSPEEVARIKAEQAAKVAALAGKGG